MYASYADNITCNNIFFFTRIKEIGNIFSSALRSLNPIIHKGALNPVDLILFLCVNRLC